MKFDFQKLIWIIIIGLIIYKWWKYDESNYANDYLKIQIEALVLAAIAHFGHQFYKKKIQKK